jgi:hypothetical protein
VPRGTRVLLRENGGGGRRAKHSKMQLKSIFKEKLKKMKIVGGFF